MDFTTSLQTARSTVLSGPTSLRTGRSRVHPYSRINGTEPSTHHFHHFWDDDSYPTRILWCKDLLVPPTLEYLVHLSVVAPHRNDRSTQGPGGTPTPPSLFLPLES